MRMSSVPNPSGYREVTPITVHDTLGSARIVDVREPHEYGDALGHVAEAALVPLSDLRDAASAWDRQAPIILVDRSGGRSALAAAMLVRMGFDDVMSMTGGMLAWNDAGLPIVR